MIDIKNKECEHVNLGENVRELFRWKCDKKPASATIMIKVLCDTCGGIVVEYFDI